MDRRNYNNYINSPIEYRDGKLLSPRVDIHVMSDHEDLIMQRSAEIICQRGGDILNVGFGMGIIDSYIKGLNPTSHVIVEAHPDVVDRAYEMGFSDDKTTIKHSDWRPLVNEWIERGVKFDGIYFDTIVLDLSVNEWLDFSLLAHKLLKQGGIYSYFNHTASRLEPNLQQLIENTGLETRVEIIPLSEIKGKVKGEFDNKLLNQADYELIWYIKHE